MKLIPSVLLLLLLQGCISIPFLKSAGDAAKSVGEARSSYGTGQLKDKTGTALIDLIGVREKRAETEQLQIKSDADTLAALLKLIESQSNTVTVQHIPHVLKAVSDDRKARVEIAKQSTGFGIVLATAFWGVLIIVVLGAWRVYKHIFPKVTKATYA